MAAAEADDRKAAADLERYRGLAAKQSSRRSSSTRRRRRAKPRAANLEAARKQAAAAGSQVSASGAARPRRRRQARRGGGRGANARLQLSYAVIIAPVDGIVAKRSAEPGALVQVGPDAACRGAGPRRVGHGEPQGDPAREVKVGDPVEFTVDAYPRPDFQGKVESLSPATGARFALLPPDNATGNFTKVVQRVPVRIAVDAGRPGAPAAAGHVGRRDDRRAD